MPAGCDLAGRFIPKLSGKSNRGPHWVFRATASHYARYPSARGRRPTLKGTFPNTRIREKPQMIAFLLSPLGRWIAAAVVGLVLIAGTYAKGRYDGSAACEARWKTRVAEEQARQVEENAAAKAAERARIAELNARIKQQDELIDVLDNEAAADPRAADCGLGIDGVRRVQGVR